MWTLTCLPVVGTQSILGCSGFFKWCLALLEASVQVLRPTACTSLLYWLYCIHSLLCLELRLGPTQHKLNNSSLRWIIHWEQLCVMVHSKKNLTQFWDKPKHWVKNIIKKINPTAGFIHIWPNNPAFFRVYRILQWNIEHLFFTLSLFIFPYLVYFFSWADPPATNKKMNEENTIMSSTYFPNTSFFNPKVSPFRHFALVWL